MLIKEKKIVIFGHFKRGNFIWNDVTMQVVHRISFGQSYPLAMRASRSVHVHMNVLLHGCCTSSGLINSFSTVTTATRPALFRVNLALGHFLLPQLLVPCNDPLGLNCSRLQDMGHFLRRKFPSDGRREGVRPIAHGLAGRAFLVFVAILGFSRFPSVLCLGFQTIRDLSSNHRLKYEITDWLKIVAAKTLQFFKIIIRQQILFQAR